MLKISFYSRISELENFRKLYSLDEQYAKYPKVAARVISSEPDTTGTMNL